MDAILRKIERLMDEHDEEGQAKPPLRLFGQASKAQTFEERLLAELEPLLVEFEGFITASGRSVESFLEKLMPTKIEPGHKLGITLVLADRKLLLGLDRLDEQVKERVRAVPPKRRKVDLTFGQIDMLAEVVKKQAKKATDKATKKRWEHIGYRLEDLQRKYYCQDVSHPLERLAAGEKVSPAVAMRALWMKLLERRLNKSK